MDQAALRERVDLAFEQRSHGLLRWADPHAGESPLDDDYSTVTNGKKWLIIGARCDAWVDALVSAGVAVVEREAQVDWVETPPTTIATTDRIVPVADGALALVIARNRIGDVAAAGVTIGVGDPAIWVSSIPDCGCDACDGGSQNEIDAVDEWIGGIVFGLFRRLSRRDRQITVTGPDGWSARNMSRRDQPEQVIADPTGWDEVSGSSWLG